VNIDDSLKNKKNISTCGGLIIDSWKDISKIYSEVGACSIVCTKTWTLRNDISFVQQVDLNVLVSNNDNISSSY
jgi:hypothetical protein